MVYPQIKVVDLQPSVATDVCNSMSAGKAIMHLQEYERVYCTAICLLQPARPVYAKDQVLVMAVKESLREMSAVVNLT